MEVSEYDVIVIGAGPAGLIWVDHALKNKKKILLIDQGEFENATYSSIGQSWNSPSDIRLGGVGGTANAWQGQCILLDAKQFQDIFNLYGSEDYKNFLDAANLLARKLFVNFDHRVKKLQSRARRELSLPDNVKVRFSSMPIVQDWNRIFKSSLNSKSLDFLTSRVESLKTKDDYISCICLSNGNKIQLNKETKLVIATNSIATAHLLSSFTESDPVHENQQKVTVYDHPWRTKYRYQSNGNKFAKRKIFSYHLGVKCRMKTKYKFEVLIDENAIGVFELRPEFRGSIFSKILARGSQKLLGFSFIAPTYVDVWCQISQSYPIEFPNSGNMEESLDFRDREKLRKLEETSKDILIKSGFVLIENHQDNTINQAFHTTGTLEFSNEHLKPNVIYPGVSIDFENLYVSGGAGLGNCSWANPTFTIMVLASLNAKGAFKKS